MNVNKLALEICQVCIQYRRCDGKIKVSKRDDNRFDIYHSFGNDVVAYQGDNAPQRAFDRLIFQIDIQRIDWNKSLKKHSVEELKQIKRELEEREERKALKELIEARQNATNN